MTLNDPCGFLIVYVLKDQSFSLLSSAEVIQGAMTHDF